MYTTMRDVFGDNNAVKKISRSLKLGGEEKRRRVSEKQQRVYCTQLVLIQAPEATNSSPHYRKKHKDLKIGITY